MADIQPFRAYRYDHQPRGTERRADPALRQNHAEMQERYYAASPYNLIRIEKGRVLPRTMPRQQRLHARRQESGGMDRRAKSWRRTPRRAFTSIRRNLRCPERRRGATRIGFIALGRVEDYDAKVVFRHERTLSGPKADRIELLRQTRVQTGQLFLLYDDPGAHRRSSARRDHAEKHAPRNDATNTA